MATTSSPLPTLLATPSTVLTQTFVVATTTTIVLTVPTSLPPPPTSSSTPPASLLLQQHTGGLSHPNKEQITTIWVAAVMLMCILIGWNMFLIRTVLYPWKMLINLVHEAHHVFGESWSSKIDLPPLTINFLPIHISLSVAILTGANVYSCVSEEREREKVWFCCCSSSHISYLLHSINIDPDTGPISGMIGGQPFVILSAGYLGSISVGSALIMASFDTSASKVASLAIFPLFIVCFWFGRTWARIRILACLGLSIGFWFSWVEKVGESRISGVAQLSTHTSFLFLIHP